ESCEQVPALATVFLSSADKEAIFGVPIVNVVRRVSVDRGLPGGQGFVHPASLDQSGSQPVMDANGLGVDREELSEMDIGFAVSAQLQKDDDEGRASDGAGRCKLQGPLELLGGLFVPAELLQRLTESDVPGSRTRAKGQDRLEVANRFPVAP